MVFVIFPIRAVPRRATAEKSNSPMPLRISREERRVSWLSSSTGAPISANAREMCSGKPGLQLLPVRSRTPVRLALQRRPFSLGPERMVSPQASRRCCQPRLCAPCSGWSEMVRYSEGRYSEACAGFPSHTSCGIPALCCFGGSCTATLRFDCLGGRRARGARGTCFKLLRASRRAALCSTSTATETSA